ncbi:Hypothetical protein MVR_LOCUS361 [uncultured virus]|nr:Hypothetical protein MVR_LOCUS361 [uncultured virus]
MTIILFAIKSDRDSIRSQRFYNKLIHLLSDAFELHNSSTNPIDSANTPDSQLTDNITNLLIDHDNVTVTMIADNCSYPLIKDKPHYILRLSKPIADMFELPTNPSCVLMLFHEYTPLTLIKQLLNSNTTLNPLDPSQVQSLHHDTDADSDASALDVTRGYMYSSRFKYLVKTTAHLQHLNIPMKADTILDQFNNVDKAFVMLQDKRYMDYVRRHVPISDFKPALSRAWKYMLQLEHYHKTIHLFDLDCIGGLPLFNLCTDSTADINTNPYIIVDPTAPIKPSMIQHTLTSNNLICSAATFEARLQSFLGTEHYIKLMSCVHTNPNMYITGGIMSLLLNQDQVDASQYENSDIDVLCANWMWHDFAASVYEFLECNNNCLRGNNSHEFSVTVSCVSDVELPYCNLASVTEIHGGCDLDVQFTKLHEWFTCNINLNYTDDLANQLKMRKMLAYLETEPTLHDDGYYPTDPDEFIMLVVKAVIGYSQRYSGIEAFGQVISHLSIVFVKSNQSDVYNLLYHPKIKAIDYGPHKRKIEFFHIRNISNDTTCTAANLINSFHLPCVRAYYHRTKEGKGKVMMAASAVSAYMTNINFNITLYKGMTIDDAKNRDIVDKYCSRGYTSVLSSNDHR